MSTFMWMVDDDESDILDQVGHETATVRVIVIASVLDKRLLQLLETKMRGDSATFSKLTDGQGPLATFSAKIDLCYMLGLISVEAHADLHVIRHIRNKFAHALGRIDFDTPEVADRCRNLKLPEKYENSAALFVDLHKPIDLKVPKHRLLRSCQILNNRLLALFGNIERLPIVSPAHEV